MKVFNYKDLEKEYNTLFEILKKYGPSYSNIQTVTLICHSKIMFLLRALEKYEIKYNFRFYEDSNTLNYVYNIVEENSGEKLSLCFPYDCFKLGKIESFIKKHTLLDVDDEYIKAVDIRCLNINSFECDNFTFFRGMRYFYENNILYGEPVN